MPTEVRQVPRINFSWLLNVLFALAVVSSSVLANERISPEIAYERLQQTGKLSAVTITGPFDFADLQPPAQHDQAFDSYQIEDVVFSGPVQLIGRHLTFDVRIQNSQFNHDVRLQRCQLQTFALRASVLSGNLLVENCIFNDFSPFDDNTFQGNVQFHFSTFQRRPSFRDSVFANRAEFLECEFGTNDPPTKASSFANAVFAGPAIFNNSHFRTRAKFQSVLFKQDVSFLNTRLLAGATFRNVHFVGDAEFRFCQIGVADFGNRDNLTLFTKRADFRGCVMDSAHYDYVEFRGETSFVDTHFGSGGASFRYANFGHAIADFIGIHSDGPLNFTSANVSTLHFDWQDIKKPLLLTNPDSRILAALLTRLKAIGDTNGALDASHQLETRKFLETIATPLPSATQETVAFLDALGQRLIVYTERIIWGLPTGYGTKLGRILLISLAVWLLAALPVIVAKGILARGDFESGTTGTPAKPFPGITAPQFPASHGAHIAMAFAFTFRILFKIGAKTIRYVTPTTKSAHITLWAHYFSVLWYFGSLLLVLIGLTLANTSPIISKLVGELLI